MVDRRKVGRFIAAARKKKGLRQSKLAEMLNVSNKTVSRWETGQTMPDYGEVLLLCRILRVSVYDLLAGESGAEARFALSDRPDALPDKPQTRVTDSDDPTPPKDGSTRTAVGIITVALVVLLGTGIVLLGVNAMQNRAASQGDTPTATTASDGSPAPVVATNDWDSAVTVLPLGTIPESLQGRELCDEQILALQHADAETLRSSINTLEDLIAWGSSFASYGDSDALIDGPPDDYETITYRKPSVRMKYFLQPDETPSVDSISYYGAWLLSDNYPEMKVLFLNSPYAMNAFCIAFPIGDDWFVINLAAYTSHGSHHKALSTLMVSDFADLYAYLDAQDTMLTQIVLLSNLNEPVVVYVQREDGYDTNSGTGKVVARP